MSTHKLPLFTRNPMFGKILYPGAKDVMETQQDVHWTAKEIKVEKDVQDYRVKMNASELSLVTHTLQIFVEIEQTVGDIWDEIGTWFPHSEIQGCCSAIASMEKSVHAFFYQKMSDELNIDPEETLAIQQNVLVFKEKLSMIRDILKNARKNKLLTLGSLAYIEQVLLFSNFAMLKSFQANGNNLIVNTISGVDYVVNDEVLHGEFSTYLFHTLKHEMLEDNPSTSFSELNTQLKEVEAVIIGHEDGVIDHSFSSDEVVINGIDNSQLKQFIRHRANFVAESLNIDKTYVIENDKISKWFYKGANAAKMHDFFVKGSNSYSRTWSEKGFSRLALKESNDR